MIAVLLAAQTRRALQIWTLVVLTGLRLCSPAEAQAKRPIEMVVQIGHSANVTSVAFSGDGQQVLSGSRDNTLKLWDVASGMLLRSMDGHAGSANAVSFSPNGRHILSGGDDNKVKIRDPATGRLQRTLEGHADSVAAVAVAADSGRALSGSWDRTLKLWDLATGTLLRTFEGHTNWVQTVAFSPNGQIAISGGTDNALKLWDVETGRLLRMFEGYANVVTAVAFSPDGRQVLAGNSNKTPWKAEATLKLWDVNTGRLVRTLETSLYGVNAVAFSTDGRHVLSGGNEKVGKLWDVASGRLLRTFAGHSAPILSIAISPDGSKVASGSEDGALKLWDANTGASLTNFGGTSEYIGALALSPDGSRMLTGGRNQTLKIWDTAAGRLTQTLGARSGDVLSVAFAPDGRRVLAANNDSTLKIWDVETGEQLRTFRGHSNSVFVAAFSPDGSRVVSGGGDKKVKVWDAATGQLLHTLDGHTSWVKAVAVSPDGRQAISGSNDWSLRLWDLESGALLRTIKGKAGRIYSVAFSPDGKRLAAGGSQNVIELWDLATGDRIRAFAAGSGAPEDGLWSVAFSPDGRQLLSGLDQTLILWDVDTGRLVHSFEGHSGRVNSAVFSPDGQRAFSASSDGSIRVWTTKSGQQLAVIVGRSSGQWLSLTPAGFFAAGGSTSDMLGIVRWPAITTIDQVHQSLFAPDLVREALADDPNGELRDAAKVINLEKVLDSGPAPAVAITSPAPNRQSSSDLLPVTARVTDNGEGVGRIEWRVNGATAAVVPKPAGRGPDYTVTRELALDAGENVIEVVAYNGSNLLASLPALTTITYTGPPDAAKPKLHILAIGINSYTDKGWLERGHIHRGFPALTLAVKDAQSFGAQMKRAAGSLYRDVIVTPVLDKDATQENLEQVVERIAKDIHPRDTFILFAAAHGASENGRFYLIPQDYQGGPDALKERAIGQDRLQDWLANRIKAKKAIILLDTCESGALVAGYLRSRTEEAASEAGVGRLHEATGRPVLTAAALGQFAREGVVDASGARQGIFTRAILDALKSGDSNNNGTIELSELVAYVQAEVPKLAAKYGGTATTRTDAATPMRGGQSARFGSRGEDFTFANRLQ